MEFVDAIGNEMTPKRFMIPASSTYTIACPLHKVTSIRRLAPATWCCYGTRSTCDNCGSSFAIVALDAGPTGGARGARQWRDLAQRYRLETFMA